MNIILATTDKLEDAAQLAFKWIDEAEFAVEDKELREEIGRIFLNGIIVLAYDGDKAVGVLAGYKMEHFWTKDKTACEHWIYILPEYRKQGITYQMCQTFFGWAKFQGCSALVLTPNLFGSDNPDDIRDRLKKYDFKVYGYVMRRDM